ncbi:enoyl-CoA hydratase/isomerase family protein [Shinella sp.]|uniref:enoyl-CoA hydratase/isomerase family protein n=1 Tax=Shinella sp. TaxID=1870904 RepID=UPI0029A9FED9|nr:enoyl-CoA hydratase/isomerase family protein [Shinella sp.]MDX3973794.1 enoyl-CoA hydratase/isomerase family protein [Shinella sp.]
MTNFILTEQRGACRVITLNRPEVLNAWHSPMRSALMDALEAAEHDASVGAIIITGAGERAFGAGQDLNETKTFDPDRAELWIGEWERLYDRIRGLSKPLIMALNGLAAGSAFQVTLLGDFRIGHDGVKMGQPEINSGIASTTGPWIMMEMIGLARTTDLTLSGRMMEAAECVAIGLINRIVPREQVLEASLALGEELAAKPRLAMKLNKQRFREVTEARFRDALAAGVRNQRVAYEDGEPNRMMEQFLASKGKTRSG